MANNNGNGFDFSIEFEGLDEFIRELDGWEELFNRNLNAGMTEYGLLLEEGARSLVNYDSGELENSIEFQPLYRKGKKVEGIVGTDKNYAMAVHERPYKMGVYDKHDRGVTFEDYYINGRGRRTHRKPKWRGLKAGRKYLERPVAATEQDFRDIMKEVQDFTLRGQEF